MTDFIIKPAEPSTDFAALAQVYYQTWLATYRGLIADSYLQQLSPSTWHPERRWRNTIIASTTKGEIVGVCSFGPSRMDTHTGWGEIYSLYVLPAYHGAGLGRKLLDAAITRLRTKYDHIFLLVLVGNQAAQGFYRHVGFSDTGKRRTDQVPGATLKEAYMEWRGEL
ncbi:N-acetyltransferase family protein [Lacticaseibacillus pantheris]